MGKIRRRVESYAIQSIDVGFHPVRFCGAILPVTESEEKISPLAYDFHMLTTFGIKCMALVSEGLL